MAHRAHATMRRASEFNVDENPYQPPRMPAKPHAGVASSGTFGFAVAALVGMIVGAALFSFANEPLRNPGGGAGLGGLLGLLLWSLVRLRGASEKGSDDS
jgi:hypothetical protein